MNQEQLRLLRERVLSDVIPLVLDSQEDGSNRFGLLLRIIQAGNASSDIYDKAYEAAKSIEDKDEQLNSLLSLLDEIDFNSDQVKQDEEAVVTNPNYNSHHNGTDDN